MLYWGRAVRIVTVKLQFAGRAVPADKLGTGGWASVVTPLGTARSVTAVVKLQFAGLMPELTMYNWQLTIVVFSTEMN